MNQIPKTKTQQIVDNFIVLTAAAVISVVVIATWITPQSWFNFWADDPQNQEPSPVPLTAQDARKLVGVAEDINRSIRSLQRSVEGLEDRLEKIEREQKKHR